jgi:hypothetical protein
MGFVASPFLTQPAQLHRESAEAYVGEFDTLALSVNINSEINIDSLWPFIQDIHATYSWDSSVVKYAGYLAPAGWTLNGLANHDNSVDIDLQNSGSTALNPMVLGTALFRPASTVLATSWVELPNFVLDIGSQHLSLCVIENEDNHWAVKALGEPSDVAETPTSLDNISIYPNPASNDVFVENGSGNNIHIAVYDELGRSVASAEALASSITSVNIESLIPGSYLFVYQVSGRTVVRKIIKSE